MDRRTMLAAVGCLSLVVGVSHADDFHDPLTSYAIYSGQSVSFAARVTVEGNIAARQSVSVNYDCRFTGNLFAGVAFSAQARHYSDGLIITGGDAVFQMDDVITGTVQAGGNAVLYSRAHIGGDLYASSNIVAYPGAVVDGQQFPSTPGPHTWSVTAPTPPTFNPGTTNVTVPQNTVRELAPGRYQDVLMNPGSTLRLRAGTYEFRAVTTYQDVTFLIDDSQGTVTVLIQRALNARERNKFDIVSNNANKFVVWTGQSMAFREDSSFEGQMRSVQSVSIRERFSMLGTVYSAQSVSVREDSTYRAYDGAKTYYVATTGSDGRDGLTPATAFRTIQHAMPLAAFPGTTIYVAPGTYSEQVQIGSGAGSGAASGTDDAPISLIADTAGSRFGVAPGPVVIDGGGTKNYGFDIDNTTGWLISGFTITGQTTNNIDIVGGASLVGLTIDVAPNFAVYTSLSGDLTVDSCRLVRDANSGHGIWAYNYNNQGMKTAITIHNNRIAFEGELYGSLDTESSNYWYSSFHYGIIALSYSQNPESSTSIKNNIISDCYLPLYAYSTASSAPVEISNNSISYGLYGIYCYAYNTTPVITNNIISNCYYGLYAFGNTPRVEGLLEHALTYDMSRVSRGFIPSDLITDDPMWKNPANGDYSLSARSPCVDAGTALGALETDIDGRLRLADGNKDGVPAVDLGAVEWVVGLLIPRVVQWNEVSPVDE